jgi:tetratricopeptide (TPR) repeat protein
VDPLSKKRQLLAALALLALILAAGGIVFSGVVFRNTLDSRFQEAVRAYQENDLETVAAAAEVFRRVKDFAPHRHLLEGMLLLRGNRPLDAVAELSQARDHGDTRPLALVLSGEGFYRLRQLSHAEQSLKAALAIDPALTEAHRLLGLIYYEIGAMNEATVELETVAEQDPEDPRPHQLLGLIHLAFERYADAVSAFRESLRRGPNQPRAAELWLDLAGCLNELAAYDQALAALSRAPVSAQRMTLEAAAHWGSGDKDLAGELADAVLEQAPDNLSALRMKGRCLLDAGETLAAVEWLTRAVRQYPDDEASHRLLMQAYQVLEDPVMVGQHALEVERLEQFKREFFALRWQAVEHPNDAEVRYQLGILARQAGKRELAHNWFAAALAMNPNHEPARQALEQLIREPATESTVFSPAATPPEARP